MNRYMLQSKIKSTGMAYVLWFILGAHYAYLGKWGIQILFWITLGGFLVWAIIDLFLIPSKVERYNEKIFYQLDQLDRIESNK